MKDQDVVEAHGKSKGVHSLMSLLLSMFSVADAILWVYSVQCKRDKIARVPICLVTAGLGTTKITQKHTPSITTYIKRHQTTIYPQHGVAMQ